VRTAGVFGDRNSLKNRNRTSGTSLALPPLVSISEVPMTLRKLTVAAAFTLAAGLALPAAAAAADRYDRGYRSDDRGHGSYNNGHGSYNNGHGSYKGHGSYNHGHRYYRPYRSYYRPAPYYYYDPYVYGYAPAPVYLPYGYAPAPYRYDNGPRIHLHLDF